MDNYEEWDHELYEEPTSTKDFLKFILGLVLVISGVAGLIYLLLK